MVGSRGDRRLLAVCLDILAQDRRFWGWRQGPVGSISSTDGRLKERYVLYRGNPPAEPARTPAGWSNTAPFRHGGSRNGEGPKNQEKCLACRGVVKPERWTSASNRLRGVQEVVEGEDTSPRATQKSIIDAHARRKTTTTMHRARSGRVDSHSHLKPIYYVARFSKIHATQNFLPKYVQGPESRHSF